MILQHLSALTRFAGLAVFLFFAAMVLADGPPNPLHLSLHQQLYALALIALFGGLPLAFFRPLSGGLLTLIAWFLLAVLSMKIPLDPPFLVPALIATLHLALVRYTTPARLSPALYATFACLLLIAGNEMFGHPPLFSNRLNPTAKLAGTWSSPGMQLQIAQDATITGHIDGLSITEAKIYPNRTAFGRLIHWRSDYIVRGKLNPSQPFLLILNNTPTGLSGTLEMPGLPGYRRLTLSCREATPPPTPPGTTPEPAR
jgi:hypothetical protein